MSDEIERDSTQPDEPESGALFTEDVRKRNGGHNRTGSRRLSVIASFVVCALAIGGYFVSQSVKPAPVEQPPSQPVASSYLLIDKTRDDFASARVQAGAQDYTIQYGDGVFSVAGMPQFALDQTKAGYIASSCTYLYVYDVAPSTDDLSQFGLDEPQATVAITYTDGSVKTLQLGSEAPTGSRYYMKVDGEPNIYTVFTSSGNRFLSTLASLHIIPEWRFAQEDIMRSVLVRPDGATVEVARTDDASIGISSVRLTQPFEYEANSEAVYDYFTSIAQLKASAFEADPTPATIGLYGLDEPRYTISVYGDDEMLLRIEVGADKNADSTYVRLDDGAVYLMNRASLDFLKGITAAELADRFANIINILRVDTLTIQGLGVDDQMNIVRTPALNADGSAKLDNSGNPVNEETFTINGQPCDESTFRKLYQIIIGTRIDGLVQQDSVSADVAPELTVTYTLNVSPVPETIEYISYDAVNYAVRRNGVTLFYIMKSRVQMIPDALKAYHEGTFRPADFGV